MSIEDDLAKIAEQEEQLRFASFDCDAAFALGTLLRSLAVERGLGVAIDVSFVAMPLFYTALAGSTPDNPNWVRRKRNVVFRFFRSSYGVGRMLTAQGFTLTDKFGLPAADYAAHGGSFPIVVAGTGCVGAVTVSGLPQRDDHALVVEALALTLGRDPNHFKLT